MACVYTIEVYGSDPASLPRIVAEAFDEVDRIDRLMSHYKPDSPLSRVNRDAARHPVAVDAELFDFISDALRYGRDSDGAFDITVGPLMKAWGFFGGDGRMPSPADLTAAGRRVGAAHVGLNAADKSISFDAPGVELDLGGIAKGYAVDRVAGILSARGISAGLISAGGSTIYALGAPPGRDGWDVTIQDPIDARKIARTISLKDRALSVAGSSEKAFEYEGRRYSHIMDPRTGTPIEGVLSVIVLARTGTAGDALDNAFFVLGPAGGQTYLSKWPGTDVLFFLPAPHGSWTAVEHHALEGQPSADLEALPFAPQRYVSYRAPTPLSIDGKLTEAAWAAAPWSAPFIDIEGENHLQPRFRTRAKMLWDDEYFYVAAEMEEPDLWGTLDERDSVIFRDNDFEVFVDPDGDTHAYYELEVNALGTPWDLLLIKPYRDGGPAVNGWDIAGLRLGIDTRGTLNQPGDRDEGWSVEIAMPWKILKEAAPQNRRPKPGEQWRVNFSRVEWLVDSTAGRYTKRLKPGTKDPLPEANWVWSPQGAIDMHMPERWGYVQFSGTTVGRGTDAFLDDPNERVKWGLRRLYYRQRRLRADTGRHATTLDGLNAADIRVGGLAFRPTMHATALTYQIDAPGFDGATLHINHDGRVWLTR